MTTRAGGPLVSVIMATYNCATTLSESLDSIAMQTYPNWELVVCDDASTDETVEVLEAFAVLHGGRTTVLRNGTNQKLAHSLNRCLEHAAGEFIARMDGDDVSAPERFQKQVEFLLQHPEVDLVGTNMRRFNEGGLADVLELEQYPGPKSMRHGVPFAHATVMVRRQVYDALGGYTVSARTVRGQDKDLWFRFMRDGFCGVNLQEVLYLVREDEAAIRRRSLKTRINSFRTSMIGYRMLGYPWHWYVGPILELGKALVPAKAILAYRRWQARGSRWTVN